MATGYSPQIATDGLVFYYDTGNGKSYAGEPTVNLAPNADFTTSAHPDYIVEYSDSYSGGAAVRNSSGNKSQYQLTNSIPVLAGEVYTVTTRHYFSSDFNTGLRTAFCYEPSNGTHHNLFGTVQGEWETRSHTFTITQDGNMRIAPYMSSAFTAGYLILDWIQVEKKSHATQFVNGTRSVTEGLKDLTKNSTIDLTNAGFDSNAQITFDGSDDRAVVPTLDLGTDPIFSIGMVIKRTGTFSNGGYWGLGGGSAQNGINGYAYPTRANKIGWDLWGRTTFDTSQDYPLNEWVHVYWVKNSTGFTTSSLKVYINGQEYPLNYTARNNSTAVNLVDGFAIGRISDNVNNYYAPGEIAITKVYNRALSAEEVQANYNAIKGRFGI